MLSLFVLLCVLAAIAALRVSPGESARIKARDFPCRDPQDVIEELKAGNRRFVAGEPRIIDDIVNLRETLAREGQEPIASVVACSDSRIPVEDIFSQPLGRLFVISTAGNAADLATRGTVRYGVEHLHTPVVVVMGHNHCGAIKAVAVNSEESGALGEMLKTVRAAREDIGDPGEGEVAERRLAVANVRRAAATLLREDDLIRAKAAKGELWVMQAMYDIKSGEVEWLGLAET